MVLTPRRTLAGAGVLAAGLAGGVAARQALLRRPRRAQLPAEAGSVIPLWPSGTRHRALSVADGATIHVAERGPTTGRPVLLLHGITLSAGIWVEQLRRLPDAGMRVIAVDLRGHGESTIGRDGLALDRLTADVVEVAEQLSLGDALLVGHSMGGMAALRLLSTAPSLARGEGWLSALALVATSARPALGWGLPGARLAVSAIGPALRGAAALVCLLPTPTLPDSEAADPLAALSFAEHPEAGAVRLTRRATARVPAGTTMELLAELVRLDETVALAQTRVPTTVVVGRDDLITPPRHARALAAAIHGAELVELDRCGHMVMLECPDELAAAILELAARSPAGSLRGQG